MFQTYKPSGRFGVIAFPLALIGMIVAVAMSYVYQLALHWIPLIYICFLVTYGLGMGLGVVGAKVVELGKIRNSVLSMALGLLLALTAIAGKFVFQHQQMIVDTTALIMQEPNAKEATPDEIRRFLDQELTFKRHIETRVEQGWELGRGGAPVAGVVVYIVWIIEFLIVAWSAISLPKAAASQPFNETMGQWASEEEVVMMLPVTSDEMVRQINAAETVDELMQLPIPKTDESNQFAVYKVNSIEGQELEDAYLSVELLTLYLDKDGNQKSDSKSLVRHAIFTSAQRKQLIENADLLNEALAEYRQAVEQEAIERAQSDNGPEAADGIREESGDANSDA